MAMRLRIQELRLEHAKILAEEREKDRELARFRIDERRRLREDTDERERQREEDAQMDRELSDGLARTRARLDRSAEALRTAEDAVGDEPAGSGRGMSESERKIAEEISQVMAGTWKPPTGTR